MTGTLPELGNPDADGLRFSRKLLIALKLYERTRGIIKVQIQHDTQVTVRRSEIWIRGNGFLISGGGFRKPAAQTQGDAELVPGVSACVISHGGGL